MRQVVTRTDDEGVEGIFTIQICFLQRFCKQHFRIFFLAGDALKMLHIVAGIFFHHKKNLDRNAGLFFDRYL